MSVSIAPQLFLQGAAQARDALLQLGIRCSMFALLVGRDHAHDLPSPIHESRQVTRRVVRQSPHFGTHRLGKPGDDLGVENIGLGPLTQRLCVLADLRRIDDHGRKAQVLSGRRPPDSHNHPSPPGRQGRSPDHATAPRASRDLLPIGQPTKPDPTDERKCRAWPSKRQSRQTGQPSYPVPSTPLGAGSCTIGLLWPKRLFGFDGAADGTPG